MGPALTSPPAGGRGWAPLWRAALPLSLAAALALALGTVGYITVGFGILTGCTDDYSCTEVACASCRGAQGWLRAGAIGQGVVLLASVVLLVLTARRGGLRRRLSWVGWALLAFAAAWFAASAALASGAD